MSTGRLVPAGEPPLREPHAPRPGGRLRRDAAYLDGPRLIQMHAIGRALDSAGVCGWGSSRRLRLLDPSGVPHVEPRATVRVGDEFELDMPDSWNVRTPFAFGAAAVDLVLGRHTWIGVRIHRHGDVRRDVDARRASLRAELLVDGITVDREGGLDRPRTSTLITLHEWATGRVFAAVGPRQTLCEVRMWHACGHL
jgi:hypothetical protein